MKRPKNGGSEAPRELVPFELVERCKKGDEVAWAELVEATHREVYSLCLRILRDPDDAAEATQDAYLKAWRALGAFRGDAMFSTWMYRVAANAAISKQRRRRRKREHEIGADDELIARLPSSASTEALAGARIELEAVEEALRLLPEHYRAALVLRDVYGMSMEEVAKQLKITETAAKVRVHRGRKRLKDLVTSENQ
ncbi:MAG: RNA polymerase sigma factor [Actinomycetota bacterium]